ncbi:hypothetical protein NX801_26855 [Streptomyces sp. LP05-1]|uniref:Uncharacterized protein n=1 Tax=Streptomyces pyxinae TaxID=2970734 RepID=A0ABT2CQ32_9ACTN|nr:hypothetical protein [Streptomyces sp. LP05-1]MCS0639197.1 hypothetical protein [Streptomyces sp. LP05-1]
MIATQEPPTDEPEVIATEPDAEPDDEGAVPSEPEPAGGPDDRDDAPDDEGVDAE